MSVDTWSWMVISTKAANSSKIWLIEVNMSSLCDASLNAQRAMNEKKKNLKHITQTLCSSVWVILIKVNLVVGQSTVLCAFIVVARNCYEIPKTHALSHVRTRVRSHTKFVYDIQTCAASNLWHTKRKKSIHRCQIDFLSFLLLVFFFLEMTYIPHTLYSTPIESARSQ